MPGSVNEGKLYSLKFILKNNIKSVLDVGAGRGTYADLFYYAKYIPSKIDAVEIWEPYIEKFNLKNKYSNVFLKDIREWNDFKYDLIIFGDILEHLKKEDAVKIWERVSVQAKYALISIPIIHYPQDSFEGNPYEKHLKDDWSVEEVLNTFSGIIDYKSFKTVGVFIAKF